MNQSESQSESQPESNPWNSPSAPTSLSSPAAQEGFDSLKEQLNRIERQNRQLTKICWFQMILLGLLIGSYLIPNLLLYLKVAVVLGLIVAGLYLFRQQLPGWLGNFSRLIFAFFEDGPRKDRRRKV